LKGEAFFEVKPNNGQSFIVYSNFSKTEVIGTSFMIRSIIGEKTDELFVSTGKVAFSPLNNETKRIYLTEGECSKTGVAEQLQSSPVTDINYAAWKTEKIVFNNTKLAQVISTLDKYYATSIKISNEEILNCRFTGTFKKSTIDQVLQVLAISLDLSSSKEGKGYILTGEGCQ